MQYYLRHYFNPDFDHQSAKPGGGLGTDESADVYSLGYAQNVIAGQILAEVVPLEEAGPNPDPRFILEEERLPAGPNTTINPEYPRYLLSAAKGYVFYNGGKITVKGLLNVRKDVSFYTGNIFFVGDMAIHGSVRSGFSVQADNILIKGMVEGGIVRARRDLMIEGGARGGSGQHGLLSAGGKLSTPFVEKIEVRSRGTLSIDKYCLYSTIYAGANMVVRGQLYGCTVNAFGSVFVGTQLGNRAGLPTQVYLGYDPLAMRQLESLDAKMADLSQTLTHLKKVAGHLPPDTNDTTRKLAHLTQKRERLKERRAQLWQKLAQDDELLASCRLLVPGKIYHGVELSIGNAYMRMERNYENVSFRLHFNEIVVEPMPKRKKEE